MTIDFTSCQQNQTILKAGSTGQQMPTMSDAHKHTHSCVILKLSTHIFCQTEEQNLMNKTRYDTHLKNIMQLLSNFQ